VGLVAACLAYGRVAQILASIGKVLAALNAPGEASVRASARASARSSVRASPRAALQRMSEKEIRGRLEGFVHRFTPSRQMSSLLVGVKRAIEAYGSLEELFARGTARGQETILPALTAFVDKLRALCGGPGACPSLLSSPEDGSACKRLNLYLRWMIRRDAVDPGPWKLPLRAKLVVPLDTHLFRISTGIGLTARKQADMKTAVEITRRFAEVSPGDPVRYDFSLTRLGINPACRALASGLPFGPGSHPARGGDQRRSGRSRSQTR